MLPCPPACSNIALAVVLADASKTARQRCMLAGLYAARTCCCSCTDGDKCKESPPQRPSRSRSSCFSAPINLCEGSASPCAMRTPRLMSLLSLELEAYVQAGERSAPGVNLRLAHSSSLGEGRDCSGDDCSLKRLQSRDSTDSAKHCCDESPDSNGVASATSAFGQAASLMAAASACNAATAPIPIPDTT
eukprot:364913-Chlamydomonas_euryale.AAC.1